MPSNAQFKVTLCTPMDSREEKRVEATQYYNAIMTKGRMKICNEHREFKIPCQIGGDEWVGEVCDVDASINIMSLAIFVSGNIGPPLP